MALTQITTDGIKDGTITGTDLATSFATTGDFTFTGANYNVLWDKSDNALEFAANAKAVFAGDLTISHTGDHGNIVNTDGNLNIKSQGTISLFPANDNDGITIVNGGAVSLFHSNVKKFETTSTGATVTGQIVADGLQMGDGDLAKFGSHDDLQIYHDGTNSNLKNTTGTLYVAGDVVTLTNSAISELYFKGTANGAVELYHDNSKKFETIAGGVKATGYLTCDGIYLNSDNEKAFFGASQDLQIYHDGTDSFVKNGTGVLRILGDSVQIRNNANNETGLAFAANGALELFFDNSKKFETKAGGVQVHGNLMLDSDNDKAIFGAGNDLQIYHDGSNSYLKNAGTGSIIFLSDDVVFKSDGGGNTALTINTDAAVELYHNNSKKFETTSSGNHSFGQMTFDGRIYPNSDNAYTCGLSNRRWTEVCAVNGSINTSDRNEKNTIVESDLGLDFINKLKPISFKWNKDDGKVHYGLVVQDIEETILSLGKSITDFGGISKEEDSPMGLGYCELIAPLIKAIQELSTEVVALKAG